MVSNKFDKYNIFGCHLKKSKEFLSKNQKKMYF